jgi:hypothetical protein
MTEEINITNNQENLRIHKENFLKYIQLKYYGDKITTSCAVKKELVIQ